MHILCMAENFPQATFEVVHRPTRQSDVFTFEQHLLSLPFELREQIYDYAFHESTVVVTEVRETHPAQVPTFISSSNTTQRSGQWGPYSRAAKWVLDQTSCEGRKEFTRAFISRTKWEIRCPYNEAFQLVPEPEQVTSNKAITPIAQGNIFINFINLLDSLGYSHLIRKLVLQSPIFETPDVDLHPALKRLPGLQNVMFTPGSWIIRGPIYPEATLSIDVPICLGEPVFTEPEILDIFKNSHMWKSHTIYSSARNIAEMSIDERRFHVKVSFLVREGHASGMGIVFPHDWECKVCTWDVDLGQISGFEKVERRNLAYSSGGGGVSVVSQT